MPKPIFVQKRVNMPSYESKKEFKPQNLRPYLEIHNYSDKRFRELRAKRMIVSLKNSVLGHMNPNIRLRKSDLQGLDY